MATGKASRRVSSTLRTLTFAGAAACVCAAIRPAAARQLDDAEAALRRGAGEAALVRNASTDGPAPSANKKILGHELVWKCAPDHPKWIFETNGVPDLAMLRHPMLQVHGWFGINDLVGACNLENPPNKRFACWTPAYSPVPVKLKSGRRSWEKLPADFQEVVDVALGGEERLLKFEAVHPGCPMEGWCSDLRPVLWLKADFDEDRDSYRRWKSRHPTFIGFHGLDEFDAEFGGHAEVMARIKEMDPVIYERIDREFPAKATRRDLADYGVKVAKRISNFYFGETNLSALASINPGYQHICARAGADYLWYEAELGSCSGPWRLGGIYTRGAARQYDIGYGWYLATYMHWHYTRDGKNVSGDLHWPYGRKGSYTAGFTRYTGASRSLTNRNAFYGLMIGATGIEMEKWGCFFLETDTPDSEPRPSQYMIDFNRNFEIAVNMDRGVPYNPVAVLVSLDDPYNRSTYFPSFGDKFSQMAFYNTMIPMNVDGFDNRFLGANRHKGEEGCLWNSEIGEIADALVPDADQNPADFLKALSRYRAAFLVGHFNKDHYDKASVAAYARNGGTLFVDAEKIAKGLVDPELAGVSFAVDKTPAEDNVFAVVGEGKAPAFSFGEAYAYHKGVPTTARPCLVDGNGGVIAWMNDVGRGRVVSVAVDRMLPESLVRVGNWEEETYKVTSCQRKFPLIRHLLRTVQDDLMPVSVEGDIQWGVNRTRNGWLVWLINNKGVTNWALEEQVIDPKAASAVKVTDKATGRVYERTIEPGGYGWIEVYGK